MGILAAFWGCFDTARVWAAHTRDVGRGCAQAHAGARASHSFMAQSHNGAKVLGVCCFHVLHVAAEHLPKGPEGERADRHEPVRGACSRRDTP